MYSLHAHLVFVTKHRRAPIDAPVSAIIEAAARKVCADFGTELVAFDHDGDYVHLLVAYPPKVALTRLVNSLKGVSARLVRAADLPDVNRLLSGGHLWSPSYCAVSCGAAPLDIVKQYIEEQRNPNRKRGRPSRGPVLGPSEPPPRTPRSNINECS